MATIRKLALLCGIAAFLTINTLSPVVRADELRVQDRIATEGNKRGGNRGGRGNDRGRRHGGGSNGLGWAALGAVVGLGVLSAVTSDRSDSYYVEPAPSYQVVYPQTTYYYPTATYAAPTYVQPNYVQPNYGQQVYVQPNYGQPAYVQPNYGQTYAQPPAPCNVCP